MKIFLAVIAAFTTACATVPVVQDNASVKAEVEATLANAAAAWNRGDLDAFMSDYAPGTGTTFVGSRGITRGPDAIRKTYERSYFAPGTKRDSLYFQNVEVDVLAPNVVNTIAWYVLQRGDSVTARGPTSLVMRKVGGRWLILHDHSS
jgi:uncharacterized protein (TIGR02246 family)